MDIFSPQQKAYFAGFAAGKQQPRKDPPPFLPKPLRDAWIQGKTDAIEEVIDQALAEDPDFFEADTEEL